MKSLERKRHVQLILMKVTLTNLLLIALFFTGYADSVFGQELLKRTVTIRVSNVSVKRILNLMEEQAQVKISYSSKALNAQKKVDINSSNESIESVLQKLFGNEVKVLLLDKHILLLKADGTASTGNLTVEIAPVIQGVVRDENGQPLPGVNVLEKGTNNGTATDENGAYALEVSNDNAVLVFSSIGYETQEIAADGKTIINVNFATDVKKLEEVVVVGYGTTKAKDLTGSVAAVTGENFNKGVISSPEQLLQGRTAGVTITPNSGEPGSAVTINIRGTSSIRGNNDPLYVIDGIPMDNSAGLGASIEGGNSVPRNPLTFLNPNDIESITILKDASSAAIYGSRGANGVVLITTKKGKADNAGGDFAYSVYCSVSAAAKRYDLLNASEFLAGVKQANIDSGLSEQAARQSVQAGTALNKGANTDWQKEIFRNAVSTGHNLGWGITRGKTSVRVSGSYDNQQGIVKHSGLTRLTGRVNLSQKFFRDKFKADLSATLGNVKNAYSPNVVENAIQYNPTYPIYNPDGTFLAPGGALKNPVEMLTYITDNSNERRLLTNLGLSYEIIPGLAFKSALGYNNSFSLRKTFGDPRLSAASFAGALSVFGNQIDNSIMPGNGRAVYQRLKNTSLLTEHTLALDRKIGKDAIQAVAGYSYQDFDTEYAQDAGFGLANPPVNPADDFVKDIDNFQNIQTVDPLPYFNLVKLQSFFGRVNYSVRDKYYFTGTARVDGSSKFGSGHRYGTFPAFAVKWKVGKESFAQGLSKIFYDLSLRANWGKLGSQDGLGAYDAVDFSTRWQGQTRLEHQGNKDLKWEVATTMGAGLDWALANHRLSGTVDYYHTQRDNLLFYGPVPGGFSVTNYYFSNLPGYVVNRGLEFSFLAEAVQGKKFNWNVNYNMTFYRNTLHHFERIVVSGKVNGQGLDGSYAQTFANGFPLFAWSVPVFQGFDGSGFSSYAPGGNHLANSALPTFTAGLTNNFTYNNWSLSVFFNTSRGFYVYNNTANALFQKGSLKTGHNVTKEVASSKESPLNPSTVSSRFLEKGDFIRLSNATLSYSFRFSKSLIKTLTANLSGQNLWLIAPYSGLDPEVNSNAPVNGVPSRGIDYLSYPKSRTVTIGIHAGF